MIYVQRYNTTNTLYICKIKVIHIRFINDEGVNVNQKYSATYDSSVKT